MGFVACSCAPGRGVRRGFGAWDRSFSARLGIAGDHASAADWDAALDGAGLSSRDAERTAGESGGGPGDGNCGASWVFDAGLRVDFAGGGKNPGGAVEL